MNPHGPYQKRVLTGILAVLLASLAGMASLELSLLRLIANNGLGGNGRVETISLAEFKSRASKTHFDFNADYKNRFKSLIDKSIIALPQEYTIEEATVIREYLLNQGQEKRGLVRGDPILLMRGLRGGKQLICDTLAYLYAYLLDTLNFDVRVVGFQRSIFDPYGHATVEIWDKQRSQWILSDPTFNVSFKYGPKFLSSDEIYDLTCAGKSHEISVVEGSITRYQYSYKNYQVSYFSVLGNVFLFPRLSETKIMSPLRRLYDPSYARRLLQSPAFPVRGNEQMIQNTIIAIAAWILPVLILLLLSNIVWILAKLKSRRQE